MCVVVVWCCAGQVTWSCLRRRNLTVAYTSVWQATRLVTPLHLPGSSSQVCQSITHVQHLLRCVNLHLYIACRTFLLYMTVKCFLCATLQLYTLMIYCSTALWGLAKHSQYPICTCVGSWSARSPVCPLNWLTKFHINPLREDRLCVCP